MQKIPLITLLVLVFFWGCGPKKTEGGEGDLKSEISYDYRKLPKRIEINENAVPILNEWEAFANFSRSFEIFYQAQNDEDLKLAVDDLIEKEKLLEESEYPKLFDRTEIKSRQRVIKTFLLKTQADLLGNRNPTLSGVEAANAYNIYRNQFNIIITNPLDEKLVLDEN